jgi:hypothetical protein
VRFVADKKVAEPRDAVLVRRLAAALAEYDGVPLAQHHYVPCRIQASDPRSPRFEPILILA